MKIVFLADALDTQYAGIKTYCEGLLNAIDTLNPAHEISVIRASTKTQFSNIKEYAIPINAGFPLHQRLRQFSSIPRLLRQLKPDVVVETAHFGPFGLPASIKRVTVIHDLTPLLFPQWHTKGSVWAHRLFLKGILHKADLILTVSQNSKKDIVQFHSAAEMKTEVTYLAANEKLIQNSKQDLTHHKINKPYFLFLGTIEPRKNVKTLVKAFEQLNNSNAYQLVLAGKMGWMTESLIEQINNSPQKENIVQLGFIEDDLKIALYKNAIATVFPSHYEGFGLPILEAFNYNCPVICSNNSSLPEVAGEAALYFNNSDANALSEKMKQISENAELRNSLIEKAKVQAAKFSWRKTAEETLGFIEGLV